MHERSLRERLDAAAAAKRPVEPDLWPAIQRRLRSRAQPGAPSRLPLAVAADARGVRLAGRRAPHGGRLAAPRAVALAVFFVGMVLAAVALAPGAGRLLHPGTAPTGIPACQATQAEALAACTFAQDASLHQLDRAGQVRHLRADDTAAGVTLTVWRAYADANRLAIAYSLAVPAGDTNPQAARSGTTPGLGPPAATDTADRVYPALDTRSNPATWCPLHRCDLPLGATTAVYDIGALPLGATTATFRVTIPAVVVGGAVSAPSTDTPGNVGTILQGPWSVTITVPVTPGRSAEVRQTATVDGRPLTLERVVATPLETRVCARLPNESDQAPPFPVLAGPGWSTGVPGTGVTVETQAGLTCYHLPGGLEERRGAWVVTFQPDAPLGGSPIDTRRWTFQFPMP